MSPLSIDLGFSCTDLGVKVFCDLDGVLADFDGGFELKFGMTPRVADQKGVMWDLIHGDPDFWYELPECEGAFEFGQYIQPLKPMILTAAPADNYHPAAQGKRYWVKTHICGNPHVLPVNGASHKPLFMHNVGDILIDDWQPNIDAWEDAGGVAIKHNGDFEETKQSLVKIIKEKRLNRQC